MCFVQFDIYSEVRMNVQRLMWMHLNSIWKKNVQLECATKSFRSCLGDSIISSFSILCLMSVECSVRCVKAKDSVNSF